MNPTNNSIEESNYPNDPIIKYTNKGSVSSNFIYEVINIGHYPENYKTTRGSSHPIPDNYKIKTTFVKNTITCSINYNENNDPVYRIDWVDDVNKFNVISIKSATEAVDLFLKCLKDYREQNPPKEKHIRKKIDSFDNLSTSTQRSRVISMGQSILQTFENSKSSALNINKNLEQATLVKTTFETNGTQYELTYDKKNSNAEEEAIVKVLDEHNIEEEISENILVAEESHSDEFLYIRISGDGRNVGRKIKQVMITFALLNDHENIFSPSNHYSLALYTGQEDYECLKNVLSPLIQELKDLKQNGFVDNFDKCWKVSLYISSDWKFLATVLGFNAANSNYFCPWCNCNKSQQGKLNLNWSISKKMEELSVNYDPKNPKLHNGQIRQPLFSMIPLDHWVIDELHLMLRVIDRLLSLLFNEIKITQSSNKNYSETLRKTVQEEMERIK
ncbi:1755_t:CDS:2, partial [Entrophospora sp. SA101]